MKRLCLCLAVLSTASLALAAQPLPPAPFPGAPAALPQAPPQVQPQPTGGYKPRAHRFQISSFGVWVRTNGPGYPAYRYTYRGEVNGFQRPAIFEYGYEHEMQMNGPYSLNGQWH